MITRSPISSAEVIYSLLLERFLLSLDISSREIFTSLRLLERLFTKAYNIILQITHKPINKEIMYAADLLEYRL